MFTILKEYWAFSVHFVNVKSKQLLMLRYCTVHCRPYSSKFIINQNMMNENLQTQFTYRFRFWNHLVIVFSLIFWLFLNYSGMPISFHLCASICGWKNFVWKMLWRELNLKNWTELRNQFSQPAPFYQMSSKWKYREIQTRRLHIQFDISA